MRIPIYHVDAFASELFRGNPAAVCPLPARIPDALQQSIAFENGLSETAFLLPAGGNTGELLYSLRWFTPEAEVDLCGHATLAAGHVLLTEIAPAHDEVEFETKSGRLSVARREGQYSLELPAQPGTAVTDPTLAERLAAALGARPREIRSTGRYLFALLASETEVRELSPDLQALARIGANGVGVGAPGDEVEIVSRFFAPAIGVDEDPVTGSAHATWIPWFTERTRRTRFACRQLSRRGGELTGHLDGMRRVHLVGRCVTYLRGEIEV